MQNFGVVVCADAVGLGKTRLAAAVTKLYLEGNPQTKIAIIAAKKLHPNWGREMAELGLIAKKHYELYNKNLMSRGGDRFYDEFTRHGGAADLVIIDEASELPTSVVALTLDYFDPNGQPIPEQNQLIYWNDLSRENDGLGVAIATAFKTPQVSQIVP
jgi:hypothetical protein